MILSMIRILVYFFVLFAPSFFVFSDEIDLYNYEKSIYSRNGEDGILAKIFQTIDITSRFCVELGACDGVTGSNTYLLRLQGWNSLLIDRAYSIPEYNLRKEFITAENMNVLLDKYLVPKNLDLLSMDIVYNTFYVWKAMDEKYKPAVVVIAYNAMHLPTEDKVVKYRPYYCGDGSNYYGASILAFYHLGRSKGYSLIYADQSGGNLFFIRDDILLARDLKFKNINDVEKLYQNVIPKDPLDGGERSNSLPIEYVSSTEILESMEMEP